MIVPRSLINRSQRRHSSASIALVSGCERVGVVVAERCSQVVERDAVGVKDACGDAVLDGREADQYFAGAKRAAARLACGDLERLLEPRRDAAVGVDERGLTARAHRGALERARSELVLDL